MRRRRRRVAVALAVCVTLSSWSSLCLTTGVFVRLRVRMLTWMYPVRSEGVHVSRCVCVPRVVVATRGRRVHANETRSAMCVSVSVQI